MNKKNIASTIVGVCSGLTSMYAINGAINGKKTEKGDKVDLIFAIGEIAIGAAVGVFVGKGTREVLDATERVGIACKGKIENDLCGVRYETAEPAESDVVYEDAATDAYTEFMKEMDSYDGTL